MKKFSILTLLLSLFFYSGNLKAQELGAVELMDNIMEVQAMRELTKFREDLLKELGKLDMNNITPEESIELGTIYEKMRFEYNSLIGLIKQDVLDFKNIKLMSKNSSEISARYNKTINIVSNVFNSEFLPAYSSLSQERSLIALIFPLIEKGIRFIVDIIKQKKLKKDMLVGELLTVANTRFNGTLILPEWHKVVKNATRLSSLNSTSKLNSPVTPTNDVVNDNPVTTTNPVNNPGGGKLGKLNGNGQPGDNIGTNNVDNTVNTGLKSGKLKPISDVPETEPVNIEFPAMKVMSGTIEFVISDDRGMNSPMDFSLPELVNRSRDLVVASKGAIPVSKYAFGSRSTYGEGTSFQMRITNTAFVYVFAYNSNNTCYAIYPYTNDWVRGFNMSKSRDLGVGPLMMKDDNNLLVIPSKNVDSGEENYIQINGSSSKEQLCLIVSKSELNLQEICSSIEAQTGTLSDRLSAVLNTPNTANLNDIELTQDSGKINFNVPSEDKWVMPLIFEIKRK